MMKVNSNITDQATTSGATDVPVSADNVASLTHTFNITWVNSLIINTAHALPWKIHISVGVVVGGRQHTSGTSWITRSWQ